MMLGTNIKQDEVTYCIEEWQDCFFSKKPFLVLFVLGTKSVHTVKTDRIISWTFSRIVDVIRRKWFNGK